MAAGSRLARNSLLNLAGQAAPLLVAALSVPILLRLLGPAKFGLLSLGWMVLAVLTEAGIGRAATRFAAEAHGRGEPERLPSVLWTAVGAQLLLGVLAAAAILAGGRLLPVHLRGSPVPLEAAAVLVVLAAGAPVALLTGAFRGLLEGAQRFGTINAIVVPATIGNYVLPVLAARAGWTVGAILGLVVVSRALVVVSFAAADFALFPELRRRPRIDPAGARAIVSFGAWATVSTLVSPMLLYLDRFLLAALVSATSLGYYAAPYEMATRLLMIPVSLVAALFPMMSALDGGGDRAALDQLTGRSAKALALVMGALVAVLLAFGPALLKLWLGAEAAREAGLALRILAVGVLVNALAQVPFTLLQGLGRADLTAKFHLLELGLYAAAAALLIRSLGTTGAALAWTGRVALDAVLLYGAAHALAPGSTGWLLRARVPQMLAIVAALTVGLLVAATWPLPVAGRLALLIGTGAVSAAAAWRFGLDREERLLLLRPLRVLDVRG